MRITDEIVSETAENQRKARNLAAMRKLAGAKDHRA